MHNSRPGALIIDCQSDDLERDAVFRGAAPGATEVEKMQRWTVMQAPGGNRFCIIGARRDGFDDDANRRDWKPEIILFFFAAAAAVHFDLVIDPFFL